MTILEYRKTRENSMKLVHMIIEKLPKENLQFAGKMLGFLEEGILVFEDEDDSSALMDYCIYEKNQRGNRFIEVFYDSDVKLKDYHEVLLEEMVNSKISIFEVKSVNTETAQIILVDLLNEAKSDIIFMDLGLSQTAKIGMVFFTRLIAVETVFMSSGVSFVFPDKGQVLKDISLAKFKKNGRMSSSDLFLLMFKRSKSNGLRVLSQQV